MTAADNMHNIKTAREALANHKSIDGSITALFQQAAEGKITYSHHQHTKIEAQYVLSCQSQEVPKMNIVSAEFIHWVTESKQPFKIVNNCGFHSLMKSGRHEYHILSAQILSHNAKVVFVHMHGQIAKMLQVS